jgi:hypothetical protein
MKPSLILLLGVVTLVAWGVAHYLRPRVESFGENTPDEPAENVEENAKNNVPVTLPDQYSAAGLHKVLNQMIVNAMGTMSPAQRGPPGPQGVQGPPGSPGGTTVDNGNVLRHLNSQTVAERLAETGNLAKVFLTSQNYTPQQTWNMDQSGQIRNYYGKKPTCMAMDPNTKEVFMVNCVEGKNYVPLTQQWNKDGTGRLQSKSPAGDTLCLESAKQSLQTNRVIGDKSSVPASAVERVYLQVNKCDSTNQNQLFSFY